MALYSKPSRYLYYKHNNFIISLLISSLLVILFIKFVPFYEISKSLLEKLDIDFNFQADQVIEEILYEKPKIDIPDIPEKLKLVDKQDNVKLQSSEIDMNVNQQTKFEDKTETKKENVVVKTEEVYYAAVDLMPEPVDGWQALNDKAKLTPQAIENEITGRVVVKAFIDENGFVTRTELIKGLGYGCDEIALRIVKNTKFTPGKLNGKKVKVQMSVPVKFSK